MAGTDRHTKDIVPGFSFYQRDNNGDPSGWITESAASLFVNKFQAVTPEVEEQLLQFLTYLRNLGVTTVLDAGNFGLDDRIYAAVEQLIALDRKYSSERVRLDTLKVFNDGVIEARTADRIDDYHDTPGNSGNSLLTQDQLYRLILELADTEYKLHVHSVGDKSTNTVLNAVEQAHMQTSGASVLTQFCARFVQ